MAATRQSSVSPVGLGLRRRFRSESLIDSCLVIPMYKHNEPVAVGIGAAHFMVMVYLR